MWHEILGGTIEELQEEEEERTSQKKGKASEQERTDLSMIQENRTKRFLIKTEKKKKLQLPWLKEVGLVRILVKR